MKVTENDIRPDEIFKEYLKLAAEDTRTYFESAERHPINCPACDNKGVHLFSKFGFQYEECLNCKSIYVSPRPEKEAFDLYYKDSPSTEYWATTFYKVTESARREKLWKPKAQMIKLIIEQYQGSDKVKNIVDIGGGYGVFDEEIRSILPVQPVIIEPSVHLAEICRQKGFNTIEKFMEDITPEDLPTGRTCFVSFELFEHLHDPEKFLTTMYQVMRSNDIFIFTTLSSMGIDIQVLRENSKSLSPPHHLNFLNPKSISHLLTNLNFKVLEVSTPGRLDMDILLNNKHFIQDSFWRTYLEYASPEEIQEMQTFLAGSGLSSHMMITCQRP